MFEKYRFICCKRYTSKPYSILDVSLAKRNGFIVFTGFSDYTREMIIHVMVVFISFLSSLYKDCVKVVGDNIQPLRCIFFIYCTALVIQLIPKYYTTWKQNEETHLTLFFFNHLGFIKVYNMIKLQKRLGFNTCQM